MNAKPNEEYVLKRFAGCIEYYWRASRRNKRAYKITRTVVVILGALVTLLSSLSSAEFIVAIPFWKLAFAIATPVLAAILTIAGGFSQTFHWGAAWRDMVLNAARLERERDRILVTPAEERDNTKDLDILSDLVITETQSFFHRVLGGAKKENPAQDTKHE